jgi:magnesium-transporting ATPase (P-type)
MQILSTIINILGGTSVSAIVLLGISIIIIHVNFYFQSKATLEFKKMAETSFIVKVLRNNEVVEINNSMIVPGDIYEP